MPRILTYPIFYSLAFVIFYFARNPYLEMFLRHALSGISGFILAEVLTVIAAGYLIHFICQRMSPQSDVLVVPPVRRCCYISLAGNVCAFIASTFLSSLYQSYVHGHQL